MTKNKRLFRAAKRCLCGCKLVSVQVSWVSQRAANALTAENLPTSIFSLYSHMDARASARTRFKLPLWLSFSASAAAERSVGNCSPAKQFFLERPSFSLSQAFLKVSVIFRHYKAYRVVRRGHIHNQALGWPATKSYLSSRRRMLQSSTCQALSRGESKPHISASVQGTLKLEGYITLNVIPLP